jgi:hypothetical protein
MALCQSRVNRNQQIPLLTVAAVGSSIYVACNRQSTGAAIVWLQCNGTKDEIAGRFLKGADQSAANAAATRREGEKIAS